MRKKVEEAEQRTFDKALRRYRRAAATAARSTGARFEPAIEKVDAALDALLWTRSPSAAALGQKLRILKREYGLDVQPRHVAGLYRDEAVF